MAYHIIGFQTNPITGETIFNILCDTAADLPASPVSDNGYGGEIGQGSKAVIIADGSAYLADSNRQWIYQPNPNAWVNVYTKSDIDEMITEIYETIAYYHTTLVSDTGEITFYAFAGYIGTWTIFGNGQQTGTPTPDNPIMPEFVGVLSDADWAVPITCAGQTVPVYLGQAQTVRKIRKLVFDGTENWQFYSDSTGQYGTWQFYCNNIASGAALSSAISNIAGYGATANNRAYHLYGCYLVTSGKGIAFQMAGSKDTLTNVTAWKSYLATQYAAGTPVTVWYVLETEQTTISNEPLAKIGDYADELNSADAGVTILTAKGQNTLTVDTILKPSRIEIQG